MISVPQCGHCDSPTTLTFEDAGGDGRDFFVYEPANFGCRCQSDACSNCGYGGHNYIASCESGRVNMDGYTGLVGTGRLVLKYSGGYSYNMQK